MSSFHVYIKAGADNIEFNIPDIYRDPESETTSDQIKTYIANKLGVNFTDLSVDVKRGYKLKKKCVNYILEDNDQVYFYYDKPSQMDLKKLKLECGFESHIEQVCSINLKQKTINRILSVEKEHNKRFEDVYKLFRSFLEKLNDDSDISFIKSLSVMNYDNNHISSYPFFKINECYYFCNSKKENGVLEPLGLGYMFDFKEMTYFQGHFSGVNIYHGKSVKLTDDGYYSSCTLYVDRKLSHNGVKKYFFKNEIYTGSFVDDLYANNGVLINDEGHYEGRFKEGLRFLMGSMKYTNGDIYIGYWTQNKRSFYGKMYYSNGSYYNGTWYSDKKEEFGLFYDKTKNKTYVGTFKDDQMSYNEDEYKIYEGEYYNSNITGAYEIELYINTEGNKKMKIAKTCYEKERLLVSSSRDIPCDEFSSRQTFYIGCFDYTRNFYGYGKLYINSDDSIIRNSTKADEFTSEYINEKFKGYNVYHGVYSDNAINGFGMLVWKNGDRYIGDFKENQLDGEGTIFKNNGKKIKSTWLSGKLVN